MPLSSASVRTSKSASNPYRSCHRLIPRPIMIGAMPTLRLIDESGDEGFPDRADAAPDANVAIIGHCSATRTCAAGANTKDSAPTSQLA